MTVQIGIDKPAIHKRQSDAVNQERDRRTEETFVFNGSPFDFDMDAKSNISGATLLASLAIGQGALPGNLHWNGQTSEFSWINKNNVAIPMDAQTVVAFGSAAAEHVRAHKFAARALKDAAVVPLDFLSNTHWV